jgi:hypothetical protein
MDLSNRGAIGTRKLEDGYNAMDSNVLQLTPTYFFGDRINKPSS